MAKILLIEDDALIVKIYSTRLKADGFTVLSADNGEDGAVLATKEQPDLIVLDVMMPKLDGFSVLEKLRADPNLSKIPILIYSNLAQDSEIEKAKQFGATEFIVKANISPTELVNKIKSYIKPA
jgi:CheY-like chemotaxis protein